MTLQYFNNVGLTVGDMLVLKDCDGDTAELWTGSRLKLLPILLDIILSYEVQEVKVYDA